MLFMPESGMYTAQYEYKWYGICIHKYVYICDLIDNFTISYKPTPEMYKCKILTLKRLSESFYKSYTILIMYN